MDEEFMKALIGDTSDTKDQLNDQCRKAAEEVGDPQFFNTT
jgi:hypothetical protein